MPSHQRVSREGQLEIARLAGFAEWDLGPKDRVPPRVARPFARPCVIQAD